MTVCPYRYFTLVNLPYNKKTLKNYFIPLNEGNFVGTPRLMFCLVCTISSLRHFETPPKKIRVGFFMLNGPILLVILALSIAFIIIFTAKFKVHAFLVLLLAALGVGLATNLGIEQTLKAIKDGFGNTRGHLGLSQGWGPTIAALSMGAGSMILSHANDSYFWVVSKFSDLDPSITFKAYTSVTFLIGLTTIIVIFIARMILL